MGGLLTSRDIGSGIDCMPAHISQYLVRTQQRGFELHYRHSLRMAKVMPLPKAATSSFALPPYIWKIARPKHSASREAQSLLLK